MAGINVKILNFGFKVAADGTLEERWENGHLSDAITGTSHTYIPDHMKPSFVSTNNKFEYDPIGTLNRMTEGGVSPKAAYAIMLCRAAVSEISLTINRAEIEVVNAAATKIRNIEAMALTQNDIGAIEMLVNQAFSILAANAICLASTGHHYRDDNAVFVKLISVAELEETFRHLKLASKTGLVYHDMFHYLDSKALLKWMYDPGSDNRHKVNSVVKIRMGILPQGTAFLGSTSSLVDALKAKYPSIARFTNVSKEISDLITDIRTNPEKYSSITGNVVSAEIETLLGKRRKLAAFIAGLVSVVPEYKRMSALNSASLTTCVRNNAAEYALGRRYKDYLASLVQADPTENDLNSALQALIA